MKIKTTESQSFMPEDSNATIKLSNNMCMGNSE